MNGPTVSVVVPVYNDVAHLEDAVERLLAQVGVDLEVVLVDDGSTDGGRELGRDLADRHDAVVHLALPRNGGPALAREAGVRQAVGEWVWFADSDDDWPADAVQRLLSATGDGIDAVVAAARFTYSGGAAAHVVAPPATDGPVPGREAFVRMLHGQVTGHLWNKLFRRSVLEGIEFVPARVQSDLAMTAQSLGACRLVRMVPDVVYEYRVRSGSVITTRSRRAESLELIDAAVRRTAVRLDLGDHLAYRYFHLRYIVLSGLKDAALGDYTPEERTAIRRRLRRSITIGQLLLLARLRDWRRLLLAAAGRTTAAGHLRVLELADRH